MQKADHAKLEVWKCENVEVWKCENVEVWKGGNRWLDDLGQFF
jgi:hypothetical protein